MSRFTGDMMVDTKLERFKKLSFIRRFELMEKLDPNTIMYRGYKGDREYYFVIGQAAICDGTKQHYLLPAGDNAREVVDMWWDYVLNRHETDYVVAGTDIIEDARVFNLTTLCWDQLSPEWIAEANEKRGSLSRKRAPVPLFDSEIVNEINRVDIYDEGVESMAEFSRELRLNGNRLARLLKAKAEREMAGSDDELDDLEEVVEEVAEPSPARSIVRGVINVSFWAWAVAVWKRWA